MSETQRIEPSVQMNEDITGYVSPAGTLYDAPPPRYPLQPSEKEGVPHEHESPEKKQREIARLAKVGAIVVGADTIFTLWRLTINWHSQMPLSNNLDTGGWGGRGHSPRSPGRVSSLLRANPFFADHCVEQVVVTGNEQRDIFSFPFIRGSGISLLSQPEVLLDGVETA